MKILHTSDWHLGKCIENWSRLNEQRAFVDELTSICDEEDVQLVLIAGDIFDTYNPSARSEELFYLALKQLNANGKRAVVVIAGNHDDPDRLCAAKPITNRNGIYLIGYPMEELTGEIGDTPWIQVVEAFPGGLEIYFPELDQSAVVATMPYPSESRIGEVFAQSCNEETLQKLYSDKVGMLFTQLASRFRTETVNILMSHLFLAGGKESDSERVLSVGGAMTVFTNHLPVQADYVALGHLHRPQMFHRAPVTTAYSGSPLAYSFSESGYQKLVYIVEIQKPAEKDSKKNVLVRERFLTAGKPLLKWHAASIEQAIEWVMDGRERNAWIDLEIETDRILTEQEQQQLRENHPGIVNIRPALQRSENSASESDISREGKRMDVLFSEFYKAKTGIDISQELLDLLLGILDAEVEMSE